MSLTIVTLSMNQAPFIRRAISSVLDNPLEDLEYIVYDAGSTDSSVQVIEEQLSDPRVTLVERRDTGPADGLNHAFAKSSGTILGYLNADDSLEPGALNWVEQTFAEDPSLDVLLGGGYLIREDDSRIRAVYPRPYSVYLASIGVSTIFQQGCFFRRHVFEQVRFNEANKTCWDGEFLRQAAAAGFRLKRYPVALGNFRMHADSITVSGRLEREHEADVARIRRETLGRDLQPWDLVVSLSCRVWFKLEGTVRRLRSPCRLGQGQVA